MPRSELPSAEREPALLDALFSGAAHGIAVWDVERRYVRVNAAYEAMTGRPERELLGRRAGELFGALGEDSERMIAEVLQTGTAVSAHAQHGDLPDDPERARDFEIDFAPLCDEQGGVVQVAATVRETTALEAVTAERSRLLKEALSARAHAEAAQLRAEIAHQDVEIAQARTQLLVDAGERMAGSMDPTATLEGIAAAAVADLGVGCRIELAGPPRGELREVVEAGTVPPPGGAGAEPMRIALCTGGRELGTLSLWIAERHRPYPVETAELARALASRAALHIRNAQLYAERSHIASTLQASLLPAALPTVPHVEVAARFQATGDENEVGGDFYDVFLGDEGSWWALIGDVTGKGPEAAAITSLARHTLRSGASHDPSPAANLRALNREMLADTTSTRFATLVCARVRPARGRARVTLAVGGHPPPLVLRASGALELIEVRGTLVGALATPEFAEEELDLGPGDVLLLYTDGVIELRTPDPAYGERRLRETVAAHAGRGADELLDGVLAAAVDAQGRRPRDDVALLALRVRPAD